MKDNFEVRIFAKDRYTSNNLNLLARLRNQLSVALEENPLLPAIILVVVDRDLLSLIKLDEFGLSFALGRVID